MRAKRSPFKVPRGSALKRLADTGGNNVTDAFPHDNVQHPMSLKHRNEDRRPKKAGA